MAGTSDPSQIPNLGPGSAIGSRYEIEAILGEGGMGKVFRARDKELGRTVALKLVRPELAWDPNSMQRFKKELLLASRITHKNILRIHDLGDAGGMKFISMAFVEGEDLHKLLEKTGKLPLDRALKIAAQMCAALEAAHTEGVIHRDLKPQNILVDKDDNIYITDFGLAKSLALESSDATRSGITRAGEILGTPRYMSPEQVESKPVDHRSDIYSFGLIFYEMVTGDIPFAGNSVVELMYQRVSQKPRSPQLLSPDLPDLVTNIILRCLEKDPEKRYQSASEILADLHSVQPGAPARKARMVRLPLRTWLIVGAAVVVVALALAAPSLRNALVRLWPKSSAPQSTAPVIAPKYIAVLPFRVLGQEESLKYVADGVVEALTAKLFPLKGIHLASPQAVAKVDLKKPAEEIAHALGANLLIQGTLQGAGDRLRITVTMDDTAAHRVVFNEEFSGLVPDLLTIEDDIFSKLSSALSLNLSSEELARGVMRPTEDIEAYQLYLKGESALRNRLDVKSLEKAQEFYDQAIKKDSRFALAYARIADSYRLMWNLKKDPHWIERAQGAAEQAERLNDSLPEVHYSLGSIYQATGKTNEAIVELRRAQELAPDSDEGYRRLGSAYLAAGHYPEAIEAYQKAVEANPYYWYNHNQLGAAYLGKGENDKARDAFRRATEIEPDVDTGFVNLGITYYRQGKWAECIAAFQKAIQLKPTYQVYTNLGVAYFYSGRYNEAADVFSKAVDMNPNDHTAVANLADAYRYQGDQEKARKTYDRAIGLALQTIKVNPRDATTLGLLALYYAKEQDGAHALQFIQRARSIDGNDNSLMYCEAQIHTLGGRNPEALRSLREAFEKGYPPEEAKSDPDLKGLQSDPGFAKLIDEFSRKAR